MVLSNNHSPANTAYLLSVSTTVGNRCWPHLKSHVPAAACAQKLTPGPWLGGGGGGGEGSLHETQSIALTLVGAQFLLRCVCHDFLIFLWDYLQNWQSY